MDTTLPEKYKAIIGKRDGTRGEIRELPLPKPSKNEVLLKVLYAPLNPSDFGTMMGFYPILPPPNVVPEKVETRVGLEGCGIVVAIGEDCEVKHEIGSRVTFFGLGSWG